MSSTVSHIMKDHYSGTTFNGKSFSFDSHPSGTLVGVTMVFNTGETLSSGKGITITNASDWTFEIDSQLISWNKGTKNYSLTTTSSNGIVKTFITGTWTIL